MKKLLIPALFALGLTATPFTFADDMPLTSDDTDMQVSQELAADDAAAVTTEATETVSKTEEAAPAPKADKPAVAKKHTKTKVAKHAKKDKKSVSQEKS